MTSGHGRPVAVVTGGAGAGIGQGICRGLLSAGWTVVVLDRDIEGAQQLAADWSGSDRQAFAIEFDVAAATGQDDLVAAVVREHGSVGLLVNSAGVGLVKPVGEVSGVEWDRIMDVDLRGAWLLARAVLPSMTARGSGVIVNVASIQALGAADGYGVYSAAKSGLIALTRGLAADYGPAGVRAVSVLPGLVDSPQNRRMFAERGDPEVFMADYLHTRQMVPRPVAPDDIGHLVAFLASDAAAAITGTEIVIDAGSSAMVFDRRNDPGGLR